MVKIPQLTWLVALGLLFAGPWLAPLSVQALDQKEVYRRLNQIPVFTLLNDKGNPVLIKPKTEKGDTQYAVFFLGPDEAKNFEVMFKKSEPTAASLVRIFALPLGDALKFADEQQAKKLPVKVNVIPDKSSLDYALVLSKEMNKDLKQFPGVPIFALTDLTGKQVISVQQKDIKTGPSQLYFFDEEDAKKAYEKLKQTNQPLAKQTRISAAPLQNLLGVMLKIEKPAEADRILLLPSQSSLSYARDVLKTMPAKKP